ncbi:putative DCG1-like protein [Aspergillus steynii IBT 23096]|uniref:Putative DCG1-like protein n=1 Tax=Aspergillus steynii IBT 23096 TaxID=1392250 RepID=A0A2I2FS90_9EURO|nr:putative DCG1-like protein [Aspergillus steynii IBT 23096]PLB43494.1 putative DCG1-like protein [Aspergillus steynii IBT 23096]
MAPTTNRRFAILVINPNTSQHMTDTLNPIVENLNFTDVQFNYFTAPSESVTLADGRIIEGVPSINSGEDSAKSALHCMPFVEPLIPKYDAFLVACYSAHPLVGMLKKAITNLEDSASIGDAPGPAATRKCVTGIFEASVVTSLSLISSFHLIGDQGYGKAQANDTFGIISTGSVWKEELGKAVAEMLVHSEGANNPTRRFAGVETTGLTAVELHTTPAEEVKRRISEATEKLIKSTSDPLTAICMGCAGMAGMEEAVREGCVKAYGPKQGKQVRIVDGVVAGAGLLVTACKAGF